MSGTTVADVVVDGLKRAGASRLFAAAPAQAGRPFLAAARAHGLPVTIAPSETAACVMAAVTGDLVDAPGAALIDGDSVVAARALDRLDRAALIVLTSVGTPALSGCKETLGIEAVSAAHRIAHAARLAMTEPRGTVHLALGPGVATAAAVPLATSCRPDPPPYPDGAALDRAARELSKASRPLVLAGIHCRASGASHWLRAFVEALPAPLLTTARAKGALPDPHPLMLGVLGAGGPEARLLRRADLVIGLGLDTAEAEALPEACWSSAPVLGLGPAAAPDGRVPAAHVAGDVSAIIEELATRLRDKPRADWDVAEVDRLRREGAARGGGDAPIARVVRLAREASSTGTIATVDAGPYRASVLAAWHATAPREFLASNASAPGFALPAALAACLVHPDRRVVCFTGAGELAPASAELETGARLAARLVIVAHETAGTDASESMRLADELGIAVAAVEDDAAFSRAFGRAFTADGGSLIVVRF